MTKKEIIKKEIRNENQKIWYQWRQRSKKVFVEPLKSRRPTLKERKEWEAKVILAEEKYGIDVEKTKVVKKYNEDKIYKKLIKSKKNKENKEEVYLILEPISGYVKIGYTNRGVRTRLATLQTSNPSELKIISHYDGTKKDEGNLQHFFKDKNIRGEWYSLSDTNLKFIDHYFSFEKGEK